MLGPPACGWCRRPDLSAAAAVDAQRGRWFDARGRAAFDRMSHKQHGIGQRARAAACARVDVSASLVAGIEVPRKTWKPKNKNRTHTTPHLASWPSGARTRLHTWKPNGDLGQHHRVVCGHRDQFCGKTGQSGHRPCIAHHTKITSRSTWTANWRVPQAVTVNEQGR